MFLFLAPFLFWRPTPLLVTHFFIILRESWMLALKDVPNIFWLLWGATGLVTQRKFFSAKPKRVQCKHDSVLPVWPFGKLSFQLHSQKLYFETTTTAPQAASNLQSLKKSSVQNQWFWCFGERNAIESVKRLTLSWSPFWEKAPTYVLSHSK